MTTEQRRCKTHRNTNQNGADCELGKIGTVRPLVLSRLGKPFAFKGNGMTPQISALTAFFLDATRRLRVEAADFEAKAINFTMN